ncbi:MAG: SAM-dependent methyltransferase [Planctomycetota bacterium]|jgi:SAM-dependent methyltransferase
MINSREKWQMQVTAEHYARERFANPRARGRDLRLIEELLSRFAPASIDRLVDVPCGTGRLALGLSNHCKRYLGADISLAMLGEFAAPSLLGDAAALPLQTESADVVVSCRLLHHLEPNKELLSVAAELVRVSKHLVVASFWDSNSWPGLRRTRGWRRDSTGRRPASRAVIEDAFQSAGGKVVGYASSFRFVSMQTFVAVTKV